MDRVAGSGVETMSNERDTHFAGFAQLLMQEIDEQVGAVTTWGLEQDIEDEARIGQELVSRWRTLIARRVYDLVHEACENISSAQVDGRLSVEGMMGAISDMTEWPEQKVREG